MVYFESNYYFEGNIIFKYRLHRSIPFFKFCLTKLTHIISNKRNVYVQLTVIY